MVATAGLAENEPLVAPQGLYFRATLPSDTPESDKTGAEWSLQTCRSGLHPGHLMPSATEVLKARGTVPMIVTAPAT